MAEPRSAQETIEVPRLRRSAVQAVFKLTGVDRRRLLNGRRHIRKVIPCEKS